VAWLREHPQLNRGVGRPETPRSKAWKAANLRKENAQADLAEIRLRQLHDKLVWRKDVEAAYAEVCRKVRAALEPFAKDMGRQIEGMTDVEQIERVMEDRIIAILTKLAEPTDDTAAAGKRV
jgi:CRISPR/Cas system CSM-associated protein Csm2 small subunit